MLSRLITFSLPMVQPVPTADVSGVLWLLRFGTSSVAFKNLYGNATIVSKISSKGTKSAIQLS